MTETRIGLVSGLFFFSAEETKVKSLKCCPL